MVREEVRVSGSGGRRFDTTHWSLVLCAADHDDPEARQALEALCRTYWPPIYAYLRKQGYDRASAEDLTQGFFLKLLERDGITRARAERGRFRTFLLASLRNYLSDQHHRETTLKRGGGRSPISLDAAGAERWLAAEADDGTPEQIFDRRWASAVISRALARLERDMIEAIGADRFASLRPFLAGGRPGAYGEVAARLRIGEPAIRVGVHRMRRRFGALLRQEVAHTVGPDSNVEEELRFLKRVIAR